MIVREVVEVLERFAPLSLQEPWDRSGLQVGRLAADCRGGLVAALDATEAAVDYAVEQGVGLVVVHHPIFFQGLHQIDTDQTVGRTIEKLIKHDLTLYALHTPADIAAGGLNDRMAAALGLTDTEPLEDSGIGRIGRLAKPVSAEEFAAHTAKAFGLKGLQYAVAKPTVERVAVCSGSGASTLEAAARKGADVLVCGDMKHHDFQRALELGIGAIDATHYATEVGFIDLIEEVTAEIRKKIITFAVHPYRKNFISYYNTTR